MTLFLDTGDINEIKKYLDMGIIQGVTTNPTILKKCGVKNVEKACKEIAELISPKPLSVELTQNNNMTDMMREAKEKAEWAHNIVIKVPFHGPNGETENLKVIKQLSGDRIKVNATAMMSAQQCYLAALAGAKYVSLFCGRVNNMGYNSIEEIKKTRKLLDTFNLDSEIICASTREVLNVVEWLCAGAHIVTVLPNILEGMIWHPYTEKTVQMFLKDAKGSKK